MKALAGGRLLVATHNEGKVEEMRALMAPHGIACVSAKELGLPEPAETETTFAGNARIKAHAAARATGLPALADDSGIEVEALDGAPGVHTADWAVVPGGGRDFMQAMTRTWTELEAISAPLPRKARFHATLALAWPDGRDALFEGQVDGDLVWPPRGTLGHGYDPIFRPAGADRTFAEMAPEEKNRISHRANAFRELINWMETNCV